MKKETILKILTIIIAITILGTMSVNVYAADDDTSGFWDDVTDDVDQTEDEPTEDEPVEDEPFEEEPVEDEPTTQEPTTNDYGTDIPKAGLAEDTAMIVAVLALGIVAVCAYNKMKYYKNI